MQFQLLIEPDCRSFLADSKLPEPTWRRISPSVSSPQAEQIIELALQTEGLVVMEFDTTEESNVYHLCRRDRAIRI
ncbi:hypothetical protein MHH52_20525 [Paenibacillus sp. FSL K6-0276]|uniref:hypothetical protein n=1 Tax=Paenibacillus sp. FSL K6-0276 TaxID=2921450 RepID=UPI0030EC0FF0